MKVKITERKVIDLPNGTSVSFWPDRVVDGEFAKIALKAKIGVRVGDDVKPLVKSKAVKGK